MKSLVIFLFILPAGIGTVWAQHPAFKKPRTIAEEIKFLRHSPDQEETSTLMDAAKGEIWVLDSMYGYLGNPLQDSWRNDFRSYNLFDSLSNLILNYSQQWNKELEIWENTFWHRFLYDDQNREIENWAKWWYPSFGGYENWYKQFYTYTNGDYIKSQHELNWNITTETWDSTFLFLNEFNVQNQLVKRDFLKWNEVFNSWTNFYQFEYVYTDSSIILYSYQWNSSNSIWIPQSVIGKIYNPEGFLIKSFDQVWDIESQQYVNKYLSRYVYDNNGFFTEGTNYEWKNNKWVPESNWKCINNNAGRCVQLLDQLWVPTTQKWLDNTITYYTYDDFGNEIEAVTNEWQTGINEWTKLIKLNRYYSKKGVSSVITSKNQSNNNLFFPNPVQDVLYINEEFIGVNLCISDMRGTPIMNIKVEESKVDVPPLPAGIYIVTLKGENIRQSSKLIIR